LTLIMGHSEGLAAPWHRDARRRETTDFRALQCAFPPVLPRPAVSAGARHLLRGFLGGARCARAGATARVRSRPARLMMPKIEGVSFSRNSNWNATHQGSRVRRTRACEIGGGYCSSGAIPVSRKNSGKLELASKAFISSAAKLLASAGTSFDASNDLFLR
jgi:hypothetical protein